MENVIKYTILDCLNDTDGGIFSTGNYNIGPSILDNLDLDVLIQIGNYLQNNGCNEENRKFIENAIRVLDSNPDANPLLACLLYTSPSPRD